MRKIRCTSSICSLRIRIRFSAAKLTFDLGGWFSAVCHGTTLKAQAIAQEVQLAGFGRGAPETREVAAIVTNEKAVWPVEGPGLVRFVDVSFSFCYRRTGFDDCVSSQSVY